jgi:hypothetical protein
MNRKEAIASGSKIYSGRLCGCGCAEKYVSSYGCIRCTAARNSNEYIKKYSKTNKAKARNSQYAEKLKQAGKFKEYNAKWRENGGSGKAKEYYNTAKRSIWRNNQLKRDYNLTLEQYDQMLRQQRDCCIICNTHVDTQKKELAVDHCHKTGIIRGLLCKGCNTGIGNFKDDINIMKRAIEYLERTA